MSNDEVDPSASQFSHSFFAAYKAACVILAATREQFDRSPALSSRIWRIWSFAFSAAVRHLLSNVKGISTLTGE
jgi:hypothetical protein